MEGEDHFLSLPGKPWVRSCYCTSVRKAACSAWLPIAVGSAVIFLLLGSDYWLLCCVGKCVWSWAFLWPYVVCNKIAIQICSLWITTMWRWQNNTVHTKNDGADCDKGVKITRNKICQLLWCLNHGIKI